MNSVSKLTIDFSNFSNFSSFTNRDYGVSHRNGNAIQWHDEPGVNLLSDDEWAHVAGLANLTTRETQVCRQLFTQKTREEIATELGIKPRTVRHHLEMIHIKLNVKSRVGVVLRLIEVGKSQENPDVLRTRETSMDSSKSSIEIHDAMDIPAPMEIPALGRSGS